MGFRERLVGALNSDPGVTETSPDGTERWVHARTSVVADAVARFLGVDPDDGMTDEEAHGRFFSALHPGSPNTPVGERDLP